MKKIAIRFALTSLVVLSSSAHAQVDIDLTTASLSVAPQNVINIGNISYGSSKVRASLQWNPITAKFDIISAVISLPTDPTICSLGRIPSTYTNYSTGGDRYSTDITFTLNPSARTITVAYTPVATFDAESLFTRNTLDSLWSFSFVQQGTQLYLTKDSGSLSTNTALFAQSPDPISGAVVDWYTVPVGTTRYATITHIPSWFSFDLPISSVVDTGQSGRTPQTFTCM